jgi:hypothetical protein
MVPSWKGLLIQRPHGGPAGYPEAAASNPNYRR